MNGATITNSTAARPRARRGGRETRRGACGSGASRVGAQRVVVQDDLVDAGSAHRIGVRVRARACRRRRTARCIRRIRSSRCPSARPAAAGRSIQSPTTGIVPCPLYGACAIHEWARPARAARDVRPGCGKSCGPFAVRADVIRHSVKPRSGSCLELPARRCLRRRRLHRLPPPARVGSRGHKVRRECAWSSFHRPGTGQSACSVPGPSARCCCRAWL